MDVEKNEEKKSFFSQKLPHGNPTHAAIMLAAGGYVIFMGCQMVKNTVSGNSTMSMKMTLVLAGLMAVIGLGVMGYGVWIWHVYHKELQKNREVTEATQTDSENLS